MNKKFSIKDLPIIRSFLDLFDDGTGETAKPVSKERALPMHKIYQHVDKQLQLAGSVDYEMGGYCNDVYVDPSGVFAIATKNDGKMYKSLITVTENNDVEIGEWMEVVTDFKPVVGRVSGGITIERQVDGKVRWYAWPACTAALNRSGEIDSRDLFDSFIENIERTGEYPELDFFHLGQELVLGRADYVTREDYAYCATGYFYDSEIARLAIKAIEKDPEYWGNSIQYYPSEPPEMMRTEDGEIPVYTAGVNRFISLLPEDTAASILTSISTEGVDRMNKKVKEALKKIGVNDDVITALDERTRAVNAGLEGEIKREKTPASKTAKTAAAAVAAPAADVKREKLTAQVKALIADPEFKAVLREVVGEIAAESNAAPAAEATADDAEDTEDEAGEEDEESTEEAPAAAAAVMSNERADRIEALLNNIKTRLDEQEEDVEEELRTILEDLPSKVSKTKIVRARSSRNTAQSATTPSLERAATSVLENIRERRTA